jgi:hypothetical protein
VHYRRDEEGFCRVFSGKGLKKIKFEKEVPIHKCLKNGYLPPDQRTDGVGPGTSCSSNGREVPKLFPDPSREPLRE